MLPPTPENIQRAKDFLLQKWKERAKEYGKPEPYSLAGACKFAALFAQAIFGGDIEAHADHCWLVPASGPKVIDLTDGVDAKEYGFMPEEFYESDAEFMYDDPFNGVENAEFKESLDSCRPRVKRWVKEFNRQNA